VYREMNRLRIQLRILSVLVLLTLVVCLGIMLILGLEVTRKRRILLLPEPMSTNVSKETQRSLGQLRRTLSIADSRSSLKQNTSVYILQIRGPIGVDSVGPAVVPLPILVCFPWSFGADQCASSEGFLVTFTPGGRDIVIECDYSLPPARWKEFFHFDFSERTPDPMGNLQYTRECESKPIDQTFWVLLSHPDSTRVVRPQSSEGLRPSVQGGEIRHNLMMTVPLLQGILVALKPTDEGRIGTGRNTQENERV
jgi:hypothetical protein